MTAGMFSVRQQQEEEEEVQQCQIVYMDVSTIERDQDQQWDFAAALQEEHLFLELQIMPSYIL